MGGRAPDGRREIMCVLRQSGKLCVCVREGMASLFQAISGQHIHEGRRSLSGERGEPRPGYFLYSSHMPPSLLS